MTRPLLCLRLYLIVDLASATVEAPWTLKKKSIAKLVVVLAQIPNVAQRKSVLAQPTECMEGNDVERVVNAEAEEDDTSGR